jgi:hypothetical protein
LVLTALSASAQTRPTDEAWRWDAFVGCWQPIASLEFEGPANQAVCLVPGAQPNTIERFVIVNNRIVTRERVDSTDRHPSSDESCPGWEQAEWSADSRRVYRSGEYLCPGGITRTMTGLMTMTSAGDWLDVMSVATGGTTGVRVMRYRPSSSLSVALPAEAVKALDARSAAASTARTAASAPVSVHEIIDVFGHATSAVTQAWLSELEQPFAITAAQLVELAEAGVPGAVTDVVVALAYPKVFALKAAAAPGQSVGGRSEEARAAINPYDCGMNMALWVPGWYGCGYYAPAYYGFYPYGPRYGYGGYGPLGYGRWYSGGDAAIIVIDGGAAPPIAAPAHGRVVKGDGYVQGSSPQGSPAPKPAASSDSSSSSSSPSSSSSSDSGGSSSSGSSAPASSGGERTAHPR